MRTPGTALRRARAAPWVGLVLAFLVLGPTAAGGATSHAPASRAVPSSPGVDATLPAIFQTPWAARAGYLGSAASVAMGLAPASSSILVTLTLMPRNPALFLPPPPGASALTVAQVADRYGVPLDQYRALERYFVANGVSIVHEWPDRLALTVQGPAHAVGAAFSTSLWTGTVGTGLVRFPRVPPSLPAPFQSEVAAVSGLSDGFSRFSLPMQPLAPPTAKAVSPTAPLRTTNVVTPVDTHAMYGFDALYNYSGVAHFATGIGVVLLLWGWGYDPSDLQNFFSNSYPSEFPLPSVRSFPVDGAPSPSANAVNDPSNAPQELTLDMEWAGSTAPGATLNAVYAPDGPGSSGYSPTDATMEDALNTAVNFVPNAEVISMSFGTPDGSDPGFQAAFKVSFDAATQMKITLLAASGDNGGALKSGCQGGPAPQFPSSEPSVIAVGGTAPVLTQNALGQVTGIASEPAWNLSGGGFSVAYAAPTWQEVGSAASPIELNGHRGIPDVAGPAFYNVFFYNGNTAFGRGTSFATPMWGGLIAEMDAVRGQPFGFVTPRLYAVGAAEAAGTSAVGLADITGGSTCITTASTGWDTATGWGTPRGLLLYQDLSGTFVDVNLTATPSPVAPGGTINAVVQVLNATSHQPLTNLPVQFTLTSTGFGGPCSGTLSNGTAYTSAQGTVTLGLPVPGCYFGSQVSVQALVSSNGVFGSNQTTVQVNLNGLAGFLAAIEVFPYNVLAFAVIMAIAVVVGVYLGTWRHRRTRRRSPPPPPAPTSSPRGTSPSSPGPSSPAPASPPASSAPAYAASGTARPSVPGLATSVGLPTRASPVPTRPTATPNPRAAAPGATIVRPTTRPSAATAPRASAAGVPPPPSNLESPAPTVDADTCPSCGAPLRVTASGTCGVCGVQIA